MILHVELNDTNGIGGGVCIKINATLLCYEKRCVERTVDP